MDVRDYIPVDGVDVVVDVSVHITGIHVDIQTDIFGDISIDVKVDVEGNTNLQCHCGRLRERFRCQCGCCGRY